MNNTYMKFIDSCVGAIARKVQDEFDESKHPRDKGGKFSSKGGEGADDDAAPSLEQYKKNVSENFDGDEEYEVEARYDRAKFHSDQFKKLKNGEFTTSPDKERRLKNYYRRLGIKKPEDAFKVWWDI